MFGKNGVNTVLHKLCIVLKLKTNFETIDKLFVVGLTVQCDQKFLCTNRMLALKLSVLHFFLWGTAKKIRVVEDVRVRVTVQEDVANHVKPESKPITT